MGWKVGTGETIRINEDAWISGTIDFRLHSRINNPNFSTVANLIDKTTRTWKERVIQNTFDEVDASRILQTPLAIMAHDDVFIWRGKSLGMFMVRSAYKLLQPLNSTTPQPIINRFYKQ